MPFALRLSRSSAAASRRGLRLLGCGAIAVAAGLLVAGASAPAADTVWQTGTTAGQWSNAANWSAGVPTSTTNAFTGGSGASIILGAGAQAKTFFVEGPLGGESTLSSGTLVLDDQLWINIASGTAEATAVPLRLFDGGSAPVSVTAANASIGVDPGKQGSVILDSRPGGSVTFAVTNTLSIGYDGSGNSVFTLPLPGTPAGAAAITAATIQTSVTAGAGADDYNYVGTYNAGHALTATNLVLGVAGRQGGADNYGGDWTVANTSLADQATSSANYLTITDGGTFTNTGAFAVGVRGSTNTVYVGYADPDVPTASTRGTLRLTGSNDLVIGSAVGANDNKLLVDNASALAVALNLVVGVSGSGGILSIDHGSTATSGGARVGVDAVASNNRLNVRNGSTLTMDGSARVGDKGSFNFLSIDSGAAVTLTGTDKNLFIGYDKAASQNRVTVGGTGSILSVKAANADIVVSGNVTGSGSASAPNVLGVFDGGIVDANRIRVQAGGEIWGAGGTIKGNTLVGAGGAIAPGALRSSAGQITFTDNVDLSAGGEFFALTAPGTAVPVGFMDVGGTLTLGGSSVLTISGSTDPGTAYIIAKYGALAGVFSSVAGLPAGAVIDYNYLGLNQIAFITAVPEVTAASAGAVAALLACSLALLERRGARNRGSRRHKAGG